MGTSAIRRGRSVVYTLYAHLVFTPKYRRGPFTDEILRRGEQVMCDVCADFGAELREFNGETDRTKGDADIGSRYANRRGTHEAGPRRNA